MSPDPVNLAQYLRMNMDVALPTSGTVPEAMKRDRATMLIIADGTLVGLPTLTPDAKMLESMITVWIMQGALEILRGTLNIPQRRYDNIAMAGTIHLNFRRLEHEYGSLEAATAAGGRGRNWVRDKDGEDAWGRLENSPGAPPHGLRQTQRHERFLHRTVHQFGNARSWRRKSRWALDRSAQRCSASVIIGP